jgi:L-arabinokinase
VNLAFYISGHGFGHATRSFEVIRTLQRLAPGIRIHIRSEIPRWFVERSLGTSVIVSTARTDVGIVQVDSLSLDEEQTAREAGAFYDTFDDRVLAEAVWLAECGASVVVGDIPPLAFAAARAADIPSLGIANFTWDWIYSAYASFPVIAPHVVAAFQEAYASMSLALRLPFAGGFATIPAIRDIPLIARRSTQDRHRVRRLLALDTGRPVVLVSFGGHGAPVPFEQVVNDSNITLVATDHEIVSEIAPAPADRLRRVPASVLASHGLQYEDLLAASDCVVSKPGYGIVSECIANETALLYTSRGHFAEYEVMVREMSAVLRTGFIAQEELRAGRWGRAIEAVLASPAPASRMALNGAEVAAAAIVELAVRPAGWRYCRTCGS